MTAPTRPEESRKKLMEATASRMRTLLDSLEGNLPLLHAAISDDAVESEVLNNVETTFQCLREVVNQFVELADLGFGAPGDGSTNKVDAPSELAKRAVGMVSEPARARRIMISNRIPDSLPLVQGNPGGLTRAMVHTLRAAIDCSPRGGMLVLESSVTEGFVLLNVHLEGSGIPGDLFDPLPGASSSESPSTGKSPPKFALLIARQILRECGGDLVLERPPPGKKTGTLLGLMLRLSS